MIQPSLKFSILVGCVLLLSACATSPEYQRPFIPTAEQYKEGWKIAQPQDEQTKTEWWERYEDETLNTLITQVNISNQTIAKYEAAYRQSSGVLESSQASLMPTIGLSPSISKAQSSASFGSSTSHKISTDYRLPLQATWAVDIWGTLRRSIEANEANVRASYAELEAAKLSAQSLLAQSYFQLRGLDSQYLALEQSIEAYEKSLKLVQNQYLVGVSAKKDVLSAQALVQSTKAQQVDLTIQRAQLEHSIAVLTGQTPSLFTLERKALKTILPAIPRSIPSELLERRPDIAAAERKMQQANAQVGVASMAWFPTLSLSASTGYQSAILTKLLSQPSTIWALGGTLSAALFDGGLREGNTHQALAQYDASIANYKQVVLSAFQQVEDQLAALTALEKELAIGQEALALSNEALRLTLNQYKAGTINYTSVALAQAAALNAQNSVVSLQSRQLIASVSLMSALGGGWSMSE